MADILCQRVEPSDGVHSVDILADDGRVPELASRQNTISCESGGPVSSSSAFSDRASIIPQGSGWLDPQRPLQGKLAGEQRD
jgi:hypothetical protein